MEGCRRGKLGTRGTERRICRAGADGCVAKGAREQMQWKPRQGMKLGTSAEPPEGGLPRPQAWPGWLVTPAPVQAVSQLMEWLWKPGSITSASEGRMGRQGFLTTWKFQLKLRILTVGWLKLSWRLKLLNKPRDVQAPSRISLAFLPAQRLR